MEVIVNMQWIQLWILSIVMHLYPLSFKGIR